MDQTAASINGSTSPTRLIGGKRDDLYSEFVAPSATLQSVLPLANDIDTKVYDAEPSLIAIKERITGATSQLTSYPPGTTPSATLAINENGQTAGEKTQNDATEDATTQGDEPEPAGSSYVHFPKFETRGGEPEDLKADFFRQWRESQSPSIKVE